MSKQEQKQKQIERIKQQLEEATGKQVILTEEYKFRYEGDIVEFTDLDVDKDYARVAAKELMSTLRKLPSISREQIPSNLQVTISSLDDGQPAAEEPQEEGEEQGGEEQPE